VAGVNKSAVFLSEPVCGPVERLSLFAVNFITRSACCCVIIVVVVAVVDRFFIPFGPHSRIFS
jgi:hypothetical protein